MPTAVANFIKPRKIVALIGEPITVEIDESEQVPCGCGARSSPQQLHDELQRLYDAAQVRAG